MSTNKCGQGLASGERAGVRGNATSKRLPLPKHRNSPALTLALAVALLVSPFASLSAQPAKAARSSPQWVRDGVVYEIFPRNFSAEGNFNGIIARLDDLKNLGVNILWLMPIHPLGDS